MKRILILSALCVLLFSCSTTRVLKEGQYRLEGNEVTIIDDPLFNTSEVSNYIRQNEFFKDHVDVSISLAVPYPCNVIEIVLTV